MHDGIVASYASVAKRFDARIIPVGTAFNRVRSTDGRKVVVPDPDYDFDNPQHPTRPNQNHSLVVGWYWDDRGVEPKLKLDFKHADATGC